MVLFVRVEVITINAHRVDMPGLAVVRGGDPAFLGAVHGSGVLEVEVSVAEGDGHVLPRVAAQGAAGVFVAFVAGVEVCWVDCFFWSVSISSLPLLFSEGVDLLSDCREISFPLIEIAWLISLFSSSMVTVVVS